MFLPSKNRWFIPLLSFLFTFLLSSSRVLASTSISIGQTAKLSVTASGTAPFSYQWYKDGTAISGATSSTYTVGAVDALDAGTYQAKVTNSAGSTMSDQATLVVVSLITFTTQPASKSAAVGASVTFSAKASGLPAPTYQWRKNGTNISGATGSSYTISSVTSSSAGTYTVVASNLLGSATSAGAVLTVTSSSTPSTSTSAPTFTTQPTSKSVTPGTSVTFSAAATGSPAPTYQWRKNGVAISGAKSKTYTIASANEGSEGVYTVVATNSAGSKTSNGATLTVGFATSAPVFTTQPVSKTASVGSSVSFTSAATGSPAPTYQWRKDGVAISGATSASYTIKSVSTGSAGVYTVIISNTAGTKTSSWATLTVSTAKAAPVFTTQPVGKSATAGTPVKLTAVATGSPTPTYQWRRNGVNITGATSSSYTINSVSGSNTGTYTVVASNSVGSVTSRSAVVSIASSSATLAATTSAMTMSAAAEAAPLVNVDFNADGGNDLVWQNVSTGQCVVWLMSGTAVKSKVTVGTYPTDSVLRGAGDFDGDGNADLLWQNTTTGESSIWLMSGTSVSSRISLGKTDANWEICGTGEFNGDGNTDIIWQNRSTGERSIWLMSGTSMASKVSLGTVGTDWEICGAGDFNGDGDSDVVWQNILTGERSIWLMTGTQISSKVSLGTISTDWELAGTGDFNGDGNSDLIWQNLITGECSIWLMDGTTRSAIVTLGTQSASWVVGN